MKDQGRRVGEWQSSGLRSIFVASMFEPSRQRYEIQ